MTVLPRLWHRPDLRRLYRPVEVLTDAAPSVGGRCNRARPSGVREVGITLWLSCGEVPAHPPEHVMTDSASAETFLLPVSEGASRLGLSPLALRARVRRGSIPSRRGNAGQILVEVPANAAAHAGKIASTSLPG
jgi:hypothetical protein